MVRVWMVLGGLCLSTVSPAEASCTRKSVAQTKSAVDSFLFRPATILDQHPKAGTPLSMAVSNVVTADPNNTIEKTLDLIRASDAEQRRAIGRGLAFASTACRLNGDTESARRILDGLRRRNDREALTAYMTIVSPAAVAPEPLPANGAARSGSLLGQGSIANPSTPLFRQAPLTNPQRTESPFR